MPTTTAIGARPAGHTVLELQIGHVPGFHLSDVATQDGAAAARAGSLLVEPGSRLGTRGLLVGGRAFGDDGNLILEPIVGYRHAFESFAIAGFLYGTATHHATTDESYDAYRVGTELAISTPISRATSWFVMDVQLAVAVMRLDAEGRFCVRTDVLCNGPYEEGRVRGFYPASTVSLGFDAGRVRWPVLNHARVAFMFGAGLMPALTASEQADPGGFVNVGVSLTVGIGDDDQSP
jgi:hypothetical protein